MRYFFNSIEVQEHSDDTLKINHVALSTYSGLVTLKLVIGMNIVYKDNKFQRTCSSTNFPKIMVTILASTGSYMSN